jgi:fumarate reductase subunit D
MVDAVIVREGDPRRWASEIAALSDENLENLRQEERLGEALNFTEAVEKLRVIREFTVALAWQDQRYEPTNFGDEVSTHLQAVMRAVELIGTFTPTDNPLARRQNIFTELDNERGWFIRNVGPIVQPVNVEAAGAYAELLERRREVMSAAQEAQEALVTIREAAGAKATSDLAAYFETQAKEHAGTARTMLIAAVIGTVILLVVGFLFVFVDPFKMPASRDWIEFVRQLLPRLFLLAVIAYGVRFAVRNYTVNMHLRVTSEQRANILRTYPGLVASGQTEVQKDRIAVLLAQAAVAPVDSGYLKHPEDKGLDSQLLAVAELLRR